MDELDKIIAERSDDIRYKGWTKLHYACDLCQPECIKLLLAAGADVNACTPVNYTPLYIACRNPQSSLECVKLLIAAGANLNVQSGGGWAPLHVASGIHEGSPDNIKLLLAAGANINIQTLGGFTPLHLACRTENVRVAEALLEAGADPLIKNVEGRFPHEMTIDKKIKDLINNFGLDGGCSTKEAQ